MSGFSIRTESRLLSLVNTCDDSDELTRLLDPKHTGSFTRAAVEMILAAKEDQPEKCFMHFEQIQNLLPRDSATDRQSCTFERFQELLQNFRENAEELPEHGYPVLLLPVRLETRFTASKLMVRIYPDQIFIHAHDKSLTLPEYEAAKVYRAQFAEDQEHAWRVLSSAFGPARAAWIAAWVKTHHFQSGEEAQLPKTKLRVPRLQSLPDAFSVSAYRNGRVTTVQTAPVQPGLTVLGDFGNLQEGLFDDHSRWMVDFNAALESGMAVEIPLLYEGSAYQEHADLREGCDRLVVVGIKRTTPQTGRLELEALIDAHHYSSGIAFVEPGTPTNNTGEVRSSFVSGEDHDASYIVEVQGPLNWTSLTQEKRERINACRLASVLGMDPEKLRYLEGAESDVDSYAAEMNTILWTVTGEYYFQHLLPGLLSGADLARLRTFVKHFVRGGSFLPSIRIGRQPYGVLPVTRVPQNTKDGWVQWGGSRPDARFEQALHFTVSELHKKWLRYAVDSRRVPRVGIEGEDPDQTLLGILSMEPYSVTYQARPFLDEGFIALLLAVLREYAFGSDSAYVQAGKTPEEWMASWAYTWDLARGRAAALLSEISGAAPAVFQNGQENEAAKQVLRLLGWGKGETEPIGMVVNPEDGRAPSDYLADIYRSTSAKPGTLLGHMALRALKQTQQSSSLHKEIKDAISSLSSFSALDFFNTASDAGQISRRIEDDPAVHPERRGYGVPKKIAARILERREELGGRFSSIEQIQDVYRVGLDTMHDFLYTFQEDRPTPDIDRLFRESLDIASHRVDAWVTSFAAKRLIDIRTKPDTRSGIYLGAYGFVEDLEPRGNLPLSVGYLHAPSAGQAAAGAVLYNAFLTHDPLLTADTPDTVSDTNPFHINLTSERVRKALSILDGIRQGQPLGALLGFQFERALRDAAEPLQQYIHDFRESFPLVAYKLTPAQTENSDEPASAEAAAARNAADGTALIRDYHGEAGTEGQVRRILDSCPENHRDRLEEILENLANTLDGVASNLLHESVYQSVQGNFERAGAVLEAGSGNLPVPELESIKIDIPYRSMHCRTGMLFEKRLRDTVGTDPPAFPREAAEPRIAAWFNTVLGSLDDIGITFEFREEETDPDILSLVNVNTADAAKLRKIPGIGPDLAASIIRERSSERGLFNQTGDLVRVNGIGDKKLIKMRPFITTGYVERVNINTAIEEELCAAAGISEETAKKIVEARSSGPFAVISDLLRCGIDEENVEVIRPKAITGYNNLSLDRCGLSRIDFLYLAQFPAEGEETEIEQRLARFVRDDNALPAGQRVMIHADRRGACRNSLADAIELCRSVLDLLSGGKPMSPDTMRHAAESAPEGYSADDVERLTARLEAAQGWLDVLICEFNGVETPCTVRLQLTGESSARLPAGTQVRHRRTNTLWKLEKEAVNGSGGTVEVTAASAGTGMPQKILPSSDWEFMDEEVLEKWKYVRSVSEPVVQKSEVISLLEQASRFGVQGAFPPAKENPDLIDRFHSTRAELLRRQKASHRIRESLAANGETSNDSRIDQLCSGMKALFGKSFIILPTFTPGQAGALSSAFGQDILNGLGEERLRLWLQQMSEVREPLRIFETALMMIEAWAQIGEPVSLHIAQLPYTEGRRWLGLSIEEGAEAAPEPDWVRSPLSVVVGHSGEFPGFSGNPEIAGIVFDDMIERIPEPEVVTSLAYQYDAPGAQAPQALLLAAAGRMESLKDYENPLIWTEKELTDIGNDTIDLTKVRAVDLDALAEVPYQAEGEPVGSILPGIYLPVDADSEDWTETLAAKGIKEWIEELEETPRGCVEGMLDYPLLVDNEGQEWSLLPDENWEQNTFASGIENPILAGAGARVKGRVGSASKRIFVIDYEILQFPDQEQFDEVQITGKVNRTGTDEPWLELFSNSQVYALRGGKAVEAGNLPDTFGMKVEITIDGQRSEFTVSPTLAVRVRGYKHRESSKVWIDHCDCIGAASIKLPGLPGLPVGVVFRYGILTHGFEGYSLYEEDGTCTHLEGSIDGMENLVDSRIWICEKARFNLSTSRGSGDSSGISISGGSTSTTPGAGAGYEVSNYGLLRPAGTMIDCGASD